MSLTLASAFCGLTSILRDTIRERDEIMPNFKLVGLMRILVRRGTIPLEDSYAFCVAHKLY